MHYCRSFSLGIALLAGLLLVTLQGVSATLHESQDLSRRTWGHHRNRWTTTWGSMQQLTEPHNLPPAPFNETGRVFYNTTIRQTVQVSSDAERIRLRIANTFGGSDLSISAVTVALPAPGEHDGSGTSAIQPDTLQSLSFSGSPTFIVPNGALVVSDPIEFKIKPETVVTVSIYLEEGQETNEISGHPGSRTDSWMSFGNHVESEDLTDPSTESTAHWYLISAIEARTSHHSGAFVIMGDSITDGRGSDTNANNRWPNLLLKSLQGNPRTSEISVINQAAGGNRILADGLGPNGLSRVDRDILAQSGVKYAMIFEGVNDIGTGETTTEAQEIIGDRLILAFKQIALRVRTQGIPIFASTITPFMAPESAESDYSHPTREVTRQRVNAWIRETDVFDAVIDFDKVVADPDNPSQLHPDLHDGDYLHPNVAGFEAFVDAFPLMLFSKYASGVDL